MAAPVHLFGIRHHGPGCARSLLRALEALRPDCVLVEGPPESEPSSTAPSEARSGITEAGRVGWL